MALVDQTCSYVYVVVVSFRLSGPTVRVCFRDDSFHWRTSTTRSSDTASSGASPNWSSRSTCAVTRPDAWTSAPSAESAKPADERCFIASSSERAVRTATPSLYHSRTEPPRQSSTPKTAPTHEPPQVWRWSPSARRPP